MAKILAVDPKGVANEVGVEIGDELVAFNGVAIVDMLDYYYYDQEESFTMDIVRGGVSHTIEIEKEEWEQLGLDLDDSLDITPIRCKNKCKFCFVDQLPKGMRDTLYVKDDDYRLSFLSGNYITLTNVGEEELRRIIKLRISPLYISIHATDPKIKVQLVSNPEGAKTFDKVKRLAAEGIVMHAQVVMCPNINDGQVLANTLDDLRGLAPQMRTVAIVPLGMTGHRVGLARLDAVTEDIAKQAIEVIDRANQKAGEKFAFASDEMYLRANIALPLSRDYGEYDQIENGVGLVRMFEDEVDEAVSELSQDRTKIEVSCITGVSFSDFLKENLAKIGAKLTGLNAQVLTVDNDFFGRSITVAGLITGGDIIAQCKGKTFRDVIIPDNMLREFEEVFLDGITVKALQDELNCNIHISHNGYSLVNIIDGLIKGDKV